MVSPNKSAGSSKRTPEQQENIERAKEYIFKAISSKNHDVLAKIVQGGFPIDEPVCDHSR